MTPIKLLIILNGDSGGGIERFVANMLKHFSAEEKTISCEVQLLYTQGDVYYKQFRQHANTVHAPFLSCNDGYFTRLRKLKSRISAINPDCILSFSYWLGSEHSIICKLLKIPLILGVRNTIPVNRFRAHIKNLPTNMFADYCVANSPSVANYLREEWGIIKSKIKTINNGILIDDFPPKQFYELKNSDQFKILTVARLEPVKNHQMIIELAAKAKERGMNWQFLWAGKGSLTDWYQAEIRKNRLEHFITLCGFKSSITDLYRSSDVFLLTSHNEGLSQALLEACASALPVVVTDVPGMKEAVQNGVNGFRVPPGDVERTFSLLQELSTSTQLRKKLGVSSRQIVEGTYSFEDNVKKYRTLIMNLLSRNPLSR